MGRLAPRLRRLTSPRLLMAALVAITGTAGLVTSVVLRRLGMEAMWLRYGLAVAAAYGVFLLFVAFWVLLRRAANVRPGPSGIPREEQDVADLGAPEPSIEPVSGTSDAAPLVTSIGDALDLDDVVVVAALLLALGSVIGASLYVVFTAPSFMAELLLDGVITAALYRRLRLAHRRGWLDATLARTRVPAILTLVCFVLLGLACRLYAPEAATLGDVSRHWTAKHADP